MTDILLCSFSKFFREKSVIWKLIYCKILKFGFLITLMTCHFLEYLQLMNHYIAFKDIVKPREANIFSVNGWYPNEFLMLDFDHTNYIE